MSEIQINCLTRKLAETGIEMDNSRNDCMFNSNTNESLNESEAISVIKQLQEKVFLRCIVFSEVLGHTLGICYIWCFYY